MTQPTLLRTILRSYRLIDRVDWADSARWRRHVGLSGGEIWEVPARDRVWGVRRWPASCAVDRLSQIHHLLNGLRDAGPPLPLPLPIPLPLPDSGEKSWVALEDGFWQVEPWMPGRADFAADPREEKLAAVCRVLAEFHRVAVAAHGIRLGHNPAVERRITALRRHAAQWDRYVSALQHPQTPRASSAREILNVARTLAPWWLQQLQSQPAEPIRLIPCLRDIWHDHVLYQDVVVSGLVDFGALDYDTPATDLARLLGSLLGDDAPRRQSAVAYYLAIRELSPQEQSQIDLLDRSGVLVAGLNWIQWLWIEGRTFPDAAVVDHRLSAIAARLRHPAFNPT